MQDQLLSVRPDHAIKNWTGCSQNQVTAVVLYGIKVHVHLNSGCGSGLSASSRNESFVER